MPPVSAPAGSEERHPPSRTPAGSQASSRKISASNLYGVKVNGTLMFRQASGEPIRQGLVLGSGDHRVVWACHGTGVVEKTSPSTLQIRGTLVSSLRAKLPPILTRRRTPPQRPAPARRSPDGRQPAPPVLRTSLPARARPSFTDRGARAGAATATTAPEARAS